MIDKPLAWNVGVISTGYGPGHSVLFVLPLLVLVCLLARYFGRLRIGVAFSIGYLAHLPGDIVFAYTGDRILQPGIVLWPVRTYSSADGTGGVLGETFRRVTEFSTELTSGNPSLYVKSQLIVATLTFALWVADGSPPLGNGTKIVCRRFREYLGRSES